MGGTSSSHSPTASPDTGFMTVGTRTKVKRYQPPSFSRSPSPTFLPSFEPTHSASMQLDTIQNEMPPPQDDNCSICSSADSISTGLEEINIPRVGYGDTEINAKGKEYRVAEVNVNDEKCAVAEVKVEEEKCEVAEVKVEKEEEVYTSGDNEYASSAGKQSPVSPSFPPYRSVSDGGSDSDSSSRSGGSSRTSSHESPRRLPILSVKNSYSNTSQELPIAKNKGCVLKRKDESNKPSVPAHKCIIKKSSPNASHGFPFVKKSSCNPKHDNRSGSESGSGNSNQLITASESTPPDSITPGTSRNEDEFPVANENKSGNNCPTHRYLTSKEISIEDNRKEEETAPSSDNEDTVNGKTSISVQPPITNTSCPFKPKSKPQLAESCGKKDGYVACLMTKKSETAKQETTPSSSCSFKSKSKAQNPEPRSKEGYIACLLKRKSETESRIQNTRPTEDSEDSETLNPTSLQQGETTTEDKGDGEGSNYATKETTPSRDNEEILNEKTSQCISEPLSKETDSHKSEAKPDNSEPSRKIEDDVACLPRRKSEILHIKKTQKDSGEGESSNCAKKDNGEQHTDDCFGGDSVENLQKGCAYLSKKELREVCERYTVYGQIVDDTTPLYTTEAIPQDEQIDLRGTRSIAITNNGNGTYTGSCATCQLTTSNKTPSRIVKCASSEAKNLKGNSVVNEARNFTKVEKRNYRSTVNDTKPTLQKPANGPAILSEMFHKAKRSLSPKSTHTENIPSFSLSKCTQKQLLDDGAKSKSSSPSFQKVSETIKNPYKLDKSFYHRHEEYTQEDSDHSFGGRVDPMKANKSNNSNSMQDQDDFISSANISHSNNVDLIDYGSNSERTLYVGDDVAVDMSTTVGNDRASREHLEIDDLWFECIEQNVSLSLIGEKRDTKVEFLEGNNFKVDNFKRVSCPVVRDGRTLNDGETSFVGTFICKDHQEKETEQVFRTCKWEDTMTIYFRGPGAHQDYLF